MTKAISNKDYEMLKKPLSGVKKKKEALATSGDKFLKALYGSSARDKHKYKYGKKGKQKPETMSDMQMHRAKKKVSEGIEDDPVLTKVAPSLKGRKFKRTVETDESGKTAGRTRKDYAQPTLKTPPPERKSLEYKAEGGMIGRKKKTGDARKAPKVHPMLAAARKREPHPTGGHPLTPERPKLVYKKGIGVVEELPKKKAKGGYVKKYAKGGGVRKAR